jgi:hypothetical protein
VTTEKRDKGRVSGVSKSMSLVYDKANERGDIMAARIVLTITCNLYGKSVLSCLCACTKCRSVSMRRLCLFTVWVMLLIIY